MTIGSTVRVLVAAASSCLAVPAVAQTSGGKPAEKQERSAEKDKDKKDRDKKDKKPQAPAPPKSYTDDDLKKYEEERAANPASSSDDQPLAEDHPAPEDGEDGEGRAFWVERLKAERDRIAAAETAMADLEEKIAALRNDRDPTRVMEPFRLQAIEADVAKATGELEAAKKELAQARAALEAVRQDARKRGVPNGWLREP